MRRSPFRTSRFRLALAGALSALAVSGAVSTASAHEYYPGWIQDHLVSSCAPSCTLCHTSPLGGQETVRTSSGDYVDGTNPSHRGYGLFVDNLAAAGPVSWPTDEKAFDAKLDALAKGPCQKDATSDGIACDSDGDGQGDIVELKAGNDPDTVGTGPECPKYGCGASIGSLPHDGDTSGRAAATMAALGVMLVLARRIRR